MKFMASMVVLVGASVPVPDPLLAAVVLVGAVVIDEAEVVVDVADPVSPDVPDVAPGYGTRHELSVTAMRGRLIRVMFTPAQAVASYPGRG
jgi:hypothetical protein